MKRCVLLFLMALCLAHIPAAAQAAIADFDYNNNISSCGNRDPLGITAQNWQVTTRIVNCVTIMLFGSTFTTTQGVIPQALDYISGKIAPTVFVLLTLAVVFMGVRIAAGVQELTKETMGFFLKFAIVGYYSTHMSELAMVPYLITQDGIAMVTNGLKMAPWSNAPDWLPWYTIDANMAKLIGYGPVPVQNGMLGIINSTLFSGLTGALTFLSGALGIIALIYFGLRAVYSYLSALVLMGYIMILSPLLVPLAMFQFTSERYFKKWLDLLIATMINPIVLFAFLTAFLPVIGFTIASMLCFFDPNCSNPMSCVNFGCLPSFESAQRSGTQLFSWQAPTDPLIMKQFQTVMGEERGTTAVQNFMSPGMSSSMDLNVFNFFTVDFGATHLQTLQRITFGFLGVFIVAYMMLTIISDIPRIADGIAGVFTGLEFEGLPFKNELKQVLSKVKMAAGST